MDASLEVLSQLDAITRTYIVPAFFLPSHMNTVTLVTILLVFSSFIHSFMFVGLFVCVCGSLVTWQVGDLVLADLLFCSMLKSILMSVCLLVLVCTVYNEKHIYFTPINNMDRYEDCDTTRKVCIM